jgi:hypothetical protein
VHKVLKELLVLMVPTEQMGHKVLKELLVPTEQMERKVLKEQ